MAAVDAPSDRLLERALRDDTLLAAWQRVHENAGCAGVDGVTVADFGQRLLSHIAGLQHDIPAGRYHPRPLRRILLPRPGKSPRLLAVPCVPDRLVQSAVAVVLTPLLDPEFEDFSFGYRPGRSVPLAVQRILDARDCGLLWVAEADIQSCFDVIPWDAVRERLRTDLADDSLSGLIDLWLTLPMEDPQGRSIARSRGVPQGSPLSPLLANLFLDGLDKALAAGPWRAVRYADDFVLLAATEADAREGLGLAHHWLDQQGMALAADKTRIVRFERGFSFLGVHFQGEGVHVDKPGAEPWLLPHANGEPGSAPRVAPHRDRPSGADAANPIRLGTSRTAHDPDEPQERLDEPSWRRPPSAPVHAPAPGDPVVPADREPADRDPAEPATEAAAPAAAEQAATIQPPAAPLPPRLRSLYLTEPGCYLHIDGERFIVGKRDDELAAIPAEKLDLVLADTEGAVSFGALRLLARNDGALLLAPDGPDGVSGIFTPMNGRQVQLRARQFQRLTDGPWRLQAARQIVQAKIANSRVVLRRYRRNREEGLDDPDQALARLQAQCPGAGDLDAVRGLEGAAARVYFQALADLLGPAWNFDNRNRQPPRDPVNAMLSYGYTVLFHNVHALVIRRGLDPFVGALHSVKDGHAALASDLTEPYRALVVDATILSMHTRGLVCPGDCQGAEPGRLPLDVRRRLIRELERKLNAPVGRTPDDTAAGNSTPAPADGSAAPQQPKDWRRIIARDIDGWARAVVNGAACYAPWRAR